MNWDAIGALAETGGALAVLVTLAYLAAQLRVQNKVAIAQVHQQRADSVTQLVSQLSGSDENFELFTRLLLEGEPNLANYSEAEKLRLQLLLTPLRANLDNTYQQYKNGFISEELYRDVTIPTLIKYGRPLIALELPLTKSFKAELTRLLQ